MGLYARNSHFPVKHVKCETGSLQVQGSVSKSVLPMIHCHLDLIQCKLRIESGVLPATDKMMYVDAHIIDISYRCLSDLVPM
jgi:hypothetical protein